MIEKDQKKSTIVKRSVLLAGHRTSVTLEVAFWDELHQIATRRGVSLNKIVTEIDSTRDGNLASAIRLFVLEEMRRKGAKEK